jgi:hypothetical protein
MSAALCFEPPADVEIGDLEDELARAFEVIRGALDRGDPVVVSLDERHVEGLGDVADVALAHGLLGLARALAIEGRKPGWHIAVLTAPAEIDPAERVRWIENLGTPGAVSGAVVRLGGEHLGKLPA